MIKTFRKVLKIEKVTTTMKNNKREMKRISSFIYFRMLIKS